MVSSMQPVLEPAFNDLCLKLGGLRSALRAVQVSVSSDEELSAEAHGLLLLLDEVIHGAERARKAARLPVDIDAVRRALPRCQQRLSEFRVAFYTGLNAPERVEELDRTGRDEAATYIGRCGGPLKTAEFALAACWRKVGEYSALNPGGAVPGFPTF